MSLDTNVPVPVPVLDTDEVIVRHGGWLRAVWRSRNGRLGMIIVALVLIGGIAAWPGSRRMVRTRRTLKRC